MSFSEKAFYEEYERGFAEGRAWREGVVAKLAEKFQRQIDQLTKQLQLRDLTIAEAVDEVAKFKQLAFLADLSASKMHNRLDQLTEQLERTKKHHDSDMVFLQQRVEDLARQRNALRAKLNPNRVTIDDLRRRAL